MCRPNTLKRSRNAMTTVLSEFTVKCDRPSQPLPIRKSKKSVRMQNFVTVHPIDQISSQMTPQEKSSVYYSPEQLASFSLEAKAIRKSCSGKPSISAQECLEPVIHSSFRGLELQLSSERVRNKFVANKTVMKYQAHFAAQNMTSEQRAVCLAGVTSKMTRWSQEVALEAARLDSVRAYEGDFCGRHVFAGAMLQTPLELSSFPEFRRRVTVEEQDMPANKRVRHC